MKNKITEMVFKALNEIENKEDIIVEIPKERDMGDYAVPCFNFAKSLKKNPNQIALEVKEKIDTDDFMKIEVVNGYLNFFIKRNGFVQNTIHQILTEKDNYGFIDAGKNQTIVIDYSSPNIAKPFSVGHLRSTVIGNSLRNICQKNGYKVIGVNHLGDWGMQFGKLIVAYKRWGDEEKVKNNPVSELTKLYVKFHDEAEKDDTLNEEARVYFKKLEDNDPECIRVWQWFREESLKEFNKTYQLLGITNFDSFNGEAFYNDKMQVIIDELEEKKLLVESAGAKVVMLDDLVPALIQKKDGATLYITRDLATAFYRKKTYNFVEALYVVGSEQILHFKQLKAVINKMGYQFEQDMHHIYFGMVLQSGKKMSTREGTAVLLHDVLLEAIERVALYSESEEARRKIGIGAVVFNDLKNYRINDVEFNLDDILKFEGETGPYVQYTYARIQSLLKNKENIMIEYSKIVINDIIWNIVFKLSHFPFIVEKAKKEYDPSLIAKYVLSLAQDFNRFYAEERILDQDVVKKQMKLEICEAVGIVLKEGLNLLGVETIDEM